MVVDDNDNVGFVVLICIQFFVCNTLDTFISLPWAFAVMAMNSLSFGAFAIIAINSLSVGAFAIIINGFIAVDESVIVDIAVGQFVYNILDLFTSLHSIW